MWQCTRLDRSDLIKRVGAKYLDGVETPDRDIGELALAVPDDIYVVGYCACIQNLQYIERRLRIEDHRLADIL